MTDSIKVPKIIKTSFELHNEDELKAIRDLYAQTSNGSKEALLNLSTEEQEKKLDTLGKQLAELKKEMNSAYDPYAIEDRKKQANKLKRLRKSLKETSISNKKILFSTPTTEIEQERKKLVLQELLTKIGDEKTLFEASEENAKLQRLQDLLIEGEEAKKLKIVRKSLAETNKDSKITLFSKPKTSEGKEKKLKALLELRAKVEEKEKLDALAQLHANRELLLDTKKLAKRRACLPTLLAYYKDELARTNPAIFRFLTPAQKLRLKNQLLFTYTLLYAQYQLDAAEGRGYSLQGHQESLDLCSKRLLELDLNPERGKKIAFKDDLELEISFFTKCLYYLGFTILAQWLVEKVMQFIGSKTGALKDWLTEINGKRLYWVWGGGMLGAALELLPDDFFNTLQARDNLALPAPITGYMSWIIYFCRVGFNLGLLLKHTLNGPWMNEEESKIPAWKRFTTQWRERKFIILNDLWGPLNLASFFRLHGKGFLGYAGNIATVVFLAMDLALNIYRYCEEQTKHEADMLAFRRDSETLSEQIRAHKLREKMPMDNDERLAWQARLADLEAQMKRLEKMHGQAQFNWKYKELSLTTDCVYAFALLLAFCLVICVFIPPAALAPLTVLIMGAVGAAACFLFTTIYAGINARLEVNKTKELGQRTRFECQELLETFQKEQDPNIKKQLYLEIKGLMAESDYQQRVTRFQQMKGIRSVFIDAFFPVVVMGALLFLSTGAGIGVIAAALAIAIITYFILKQFEPKADELPEFDKADYKAFLAEPTLSHFEQKNEGKKSMNRFFNSPPSEEYFKLGEISEKNKDGESDFSLSKALSASSLG